MKPAVNECLKCPRTCNVVCKKWSWSMWLSWESKWKMSIMW